MDSDHQEAIRSFLRAPCGPPQPPPQPTSLLPYWLLLALNKFLVPQSFFLKLSFGVFQPLVCYKPCPVSPGLPLLFLWSPTGPSVRLIVARRSCFFLSVTLRSLRPSGGAGVSVCPGHSGQPLGVRLGSRCPTPASPPGLGSPLGLLRGRCGHRGWSHMNFVKLVLFFFFFLH